MTKEDVIFKGPLSAVVAVSSYLLGVVNELLFILLIVMAFDYITGLIKGYITKELSSSIGLKGLMKKMLMLIVVGLSACIEYVFVHIGYDTHNAIVSVVICFFIVNEALSITENSAQLGLPVPSVLVSALEKLREVGGKEQQVNKDKEE